MATEVILPRVEMDMAEGKIAYWYVKNGDRVSKGQTLFDIETDKATMEVDAPGEGTIGGITGDIGVSLPVGTVVAWLLAEGEALPTSAPPSDAAALTAAQAEAAEAAAQAIATASGGASASGSASASGTANALLRATPLARSLARERQIDLNTLQGSGPRGRIVASDLPTASATLSAPPGAEPLHRQWIQRSDGVPLVLLHGFGADHSSWKPLAALLPGVSALALDLPNHGKSGLQDAVSLQTLAAQVLQTLAAEGVHRFHLLGHSLGGAIALAVAEQAPQSLQSLTLLSPAGLGPDIHGPFLDGLCRAESEAALRPWLQELVSDPGWISASFVATAHKQLSAPQRRLALRQMADQLMPHGTQADNLRHALRTHPRLPTKVIWGSDDRIIPVRHGFGLPGHVGLHVLAGVGHLPYVESAPLVTDLIAQQLRH